ncbi:RluA family pseudouridine synthase [Corallococcus sp. AB004]|uniref:RluA family pseudouridine synthase n=1 Tax=Corallococcus exiguus TaxID=83462 RepID=UPI000EA02C49|nr:RluA family pseudouridine synthase [Corallococcus exiguus]NPC70301.1 RluA family pseudouridine synthase [Corallococcus exiguus]RKI51001.1 RluA family pseudouridine synthase [Corallococcus sp. AB004]
MSQPDDSSGLNDGYVYRERIGAASVGRTTLAHLSDKYRHSTEEEWRARFVRGEVRLDGLVATGEEVLRAHHELCWHRPPWREPEAPESFELVYEDASLLAVIKPSGLPTLPSGGFLKRTLLSLVRLRWPEASALHRLGRATSGLVLFSRTQEAAAKLSGNWREGDVEKRYRALSDGVAAQAAYDIHTPIGLVPHPLLGSVHGATAKGKPSHSRAEVLERREGQTLFEVRIHTGRPEQIRIHLAAIGHPLTGDPMFASGGLPREHAPGLPGDGGYLLHAETLAFTHPMTAERLRLYAPPPAALRMASES